MEIKNINAVCSKGIKIFSASEWNSYNQDKKNKILLGYRLTYLSETEVNWCSQLGTYWLMMK